MSLLNPRNEFHVLPQYQPLMRVAGIDAETVFEHPQIVAWRKLPDRENCTLDAMVDGLKIRLHIKRYQPARGSTTPAEDEARAHKALTVEQIPTLTLVGWGKLIDRRSFVITADLAGYEDSEKLVRAGTMSFDQLLEPTADLAAKLHKQGLHHRDLYLCHFFARVEDPTDVRLIDIARVARLNAVFTRGRWITKDLAQFWYSTLTLPGVTDDGRDRWLARYAQQRGLSSTTGLRRSIVRKANWIARHDAKLKKSQPGRNISIPTSPGTAS